MVERKVLDLSLEELDEALGIDTTPDAIREFTKQEERLIGGFEEIILFHQKQQKEADDYTRLFSELYEIRLRKVQKLAQEDQHIFDILKPLDCLNLLSLKEKQEETFEDIDIDALAEDDLLKALGVEEVEENPLTKLCFVRSFEEKREEEGEDSARRKPCEDFKNFREKFDLIRKELKERKRIAIPFRDESNIEIGQYFILKGQICYVADKELLEGKDSKGNPKARLRAIFDNETESPLQQASLWRRLLELKNNGRRIVPADRSGKAVPDILELKTGSVYVARSLSQDSSIKAFDGMLLKIGVTTNHVRKRLANAKKEATYLYAPVEIIQTYEIGGKWSAEAIEKLIHKIFSNVQAKIEIPDGIGNLHRPREWFVLPLFIVDEFIQALQEGKAEGLFYDSDKMRLDRK